MLKSLLQSLCKLQCNDLPVISADAIFESEGVSRLLLDTLEVMAADIHILFHFDRLYKGNLPF